MARLAKESAVERFRGPARILLATESGSEGRNLQFAHVVCNFDIPWNPMRIEQRIGRLSRIGQQHDVQVYPLIASLEAASCPSCAGPTFELLVDSRRGLHCPDCTKRSTNPGRMKHEREPGASAPGGEG